MMSKKSIRFFNDREVRAVWDDANNKWWFSATDIGRAINDEEDYVKAGNYWRWLKTQHQWHSTRECHSRLQIFGSRWQTACG